MLILGTVLQSIKGTGQKSIRKALRDWGHAQSTGGHLSKNSCERSPELKNMVKQKYNKRQVGAQYEKTAGEYLVSCGYEILEYNFRCRMGEIDIIARDGEYLVFCEVKYRRGGAMGHPLEAVGPRKQQVISRCALWYLATRHLAGALCRFDVVGIEDEEIILIKNAFEYAGR